MLELKVAAIRATQDVAGLKKAVGAILALKTPAAYGAVWDLAFAPPKLPFKNGLPFIALSALSLRFKREAAIRELFVVRCATLVETAGDEAHHAMVILANWVSAHHAEASGDPRIAKALRTALAWKRRDAVENAAFVLGKLGDTASTSAIVALVRATGPRDHQLVYHVVQASVALPNIRAADVTTLRAAIERLTYKPDDPAEFYKPRLERALRKLAKRVDIPTATRARKPK